MESVLKNTVVFWENVQEKLVKLNKIHQLGSKVVRQLEDIQDQVLSLMGFDHDFDYVKIAYQFFMMLEFKQEQFRIQVLKRSMEQNFNKIEKIIKYHGQTFKIEPEYLVFLLSMQTEDVGKIRYVSNSAHQFLGIHPTDI